MRKFTAALFVVASLMPLSAWATTDLLYPVTGDAFNADDVGDQAYMAYSNGFVYNTSGQVFPTYASLGHNTAAATHSFWVYGYNYNGYSTSCSIDIEPTAWGGGGASGNESYTSGTGYFQIRVDSPIRSTGDYTFSAYCNLAGNGGTTIYAVVPWDDPATYFTPISGAAFRTHSASTDTYIGYSGGLIYNTANSTEVIEGSLGHGAGGNYNFTFSGFNTASGVTTCYVVLEGLTAAYGTYVYSGASNGAVGSFNFNVNANAPGGNYSYEAECILPGNEAAHLVGVQPSSETNLFTPIDGNAFHAETQTERNTTLRTDGIIGSSAAGTWVEASLGHNGGGTYQFNITGYNSSTGGYVYCNVAVQSETADAVYNYDNYTFTAGGISLPVTTTAPAGGSYTYSAQCYLSNPYSYILNVIPQQ